MISLAGSSSYAKNGHNDDWLISPQLNGDAQTISFWAKSITSDFPETFQVFTSSVDADTTSFKLLATVDAVPAEWTEYEYELPSGCKYFAVRNIGKDEFALLLDDVTYTPKSLILTAYRVYRNGEIVATLAPDATSWTDSKGGSNEYFVTAVYDEGESARSNVVSPVTAIGSITTNADNAPVFTIGGIRLPKGVKPNGGIYITGGKKVLK